MCGLQVDRDGTVVHGEYMDSSSSDSDDPSATEMQCEHQDGSTTPEAPIAVPFKSQQPHSAAQQASMLDADGFIIVQKPSRRQARHAQQHAS